MTSLNAIPLYKKLWPTGLQPLLNWTHSMDMTLNEMWNRGKNAKEIGRFLGLKPNVILGRRTTLIQKGCWTEYRR